MKPAWTAGATRGRLLLSRRIGVGQARAVADAGSLAAGLSALMGSAYGERLSTRDDLSAAERGVAETLLWHLRILAGWLPAAGARLVRTLAGRFELENIDARLAALAGDSHEPKQFDLGGLATAWPRLEQARTVEQLHEALAASAWGDQLGPSPAELAIGLRVSWARRVQEAAPESTGWVAGAGALLVARELFVTGSRARVAQLRRLPGIDEEALRAGSLGELRAALPPQAAWATAEAYDASDLWRAELGWWRRVERDSMAMLRAREQRAVVLAAVALLAADAKRTAQALAVAQGVASAREELVGGLA